MSVSKCIDELKSIHFFLRLAQFGTSGLLAHLPEGQVSLCHGAASVVRRPSSVRRPSVNFSFKTLLVLNGLVDLD